MTERNIAQIDTYYYTVGLLTKLLKASAEPLVFKKQSTILPI